MWGQPPSAVRSSEARRSSASTGELCSHGKSLPLCSFIGQNPPFHRHRQSLACSSQYQSWRSSSNLHEVRHRPFRIELRRFPQQPPEPLLHHVVFIAEQRIGHSHDLREEHLRPGPANQRHASRPSMPAIRRLCPPKHRFRPRRFRRHHRRNQRVHQSIMIGPTADAVEPRFKKLEFGIATLRSQILEEENARNLLFQYRAGEQLIRHLHQKVELVLTQDFFAATSYRASQVRRIPSVRLDLFFEEPLHSRRVLSRPTIFQCAANLCSYCFRSCFCSGHRIR
jgi:hypothetical protein